MIGTLCTPVDCEAQEFHRPRFTIRYLMVAVAVAVLACLLALHEGPGAILVALALPGVCLIGAQWLVIRGDRRLAAFGFWAVATSANLVYAARCVAPCYYVLISMFLGWLLSVLPSIAALGIAWTFLSGRQCAGSYRSRLAAGFLVFFLAVLPLATMCSLWPLRLAFSMTRPALESLANQVGAGQSVGFPRWVGLFRVAGSAVDPATREVGLLIEPNPNHYAGFVRVPPGAPRSSMFGTDLLGVHLGWGWEYREED
jgi:hypothetical protein